MFSFTCSGQARVRGLVLASMLKVANDPHAVKCSIAVEMWRSVEGRSPPVKGRHSRQWSCSICPNQPDSPAVSSPVVAVVSWGVFFE